MVPTTPDVSLLSSSSQGKTKVILAWYCLGRMLIFIRFLSSSLVNSLELKRSPFLLSLIGSEKISSSLDQFRAVIV